MVRKTSHHRGLERVQLVIPSKFRQDILSACRENIAAHQAEKRTKLLKYFYMMPYDACQKIGNASKQKEPLYLGNQ